MLLRLVHYLKLDWPFDPNYLHDWLELLGLSVSLNLSENSTKLSFQLDWIKYNHTPCDVGMSSCAPCMPCTSWPDARMNWGILAGCCCWEFNKELVDAVVGCCDPRQLLLLFPGDCWRFKFPVIMPADDDASTFPIIDWLLRGVAAAGEKMYKCLCNNNNNIVDV